MVEPAKQDDTYFSWGGNLPVNIPILFAMVGLIYSVVVLKGCNAVYHDLYLTNKGKMVDSVFIKRMALLNALSDSLRRHAPIEVKPARGPANVKSAANSKSRDSIDKKRRDSLALVRTALIQSQREWDNFRYFNPDTNLKVFLNYFSVNRDVLRDTLGGEALDKFQHFERKIAVFVRDTFSIVNAGMHKMDSLQIGSGPDKPGLIDFFGKYPIFGFWFFLSMGQMVLWFILIPLVIGAVRRTKSIVSGLRYDIGNFLFFSLIPALVVGVFTWILYTKLIDAFVIKNCYFLDSFNPRMVWYAIPGYFIAILCFGSYLFLANKLQLLNEESKGKDLSTDEGLQQEYASLKSTFDFTFLASAIVLSAFVLWIGVLFNALNNMEVFRYYTLISGRSFFDPNFIYLIGLMHSLILLIFYVPVRLQFNGLSITQQQKEMTMEDQSGSRKIFKAFWGSISTLLITASPLITTVLEKAISSITQ
ncbi:MAG: hypothetical protein BGO55_29170 [Sphingobacteriales bacterium 50-39]|nr:hypothetical protein [Sphingobacteriales bacterium]OJW60618.1 MAG: hypothetical protein BGO55_29170 [Sphingobacteriales bacterium 50-39]